jgi:hypothetical protein
MTRDKGKFTPGASGNPTGKSKTKWLTDALRMNLAANPARAKTIADKIITMAEEGDLQAANLIFDRLEGKPVQSIEVSQTLQALDPAEVDQRIMELTNRLRLATVAPLLELTAEPDDAKSKKH